MQHQISMTIWEIPTKMLLIHALHGLYLGFMCTSLLHPPIITLTNLQVGMQVWLDYHLPKQHILRASFQTKVWHTFCLAKPPLPSPMEYGWRTVKDSLHPVYFKGSMSAEFLRDLVCSCKGKSQCKKSCVCAEQNLACTDLCSCQGSESCKKVHSYTLAEDD